MRQLRKTGLMLLAGLMLGLAGYHGALVLSGQTVVRRDLLDEQQTRLDRLQEENLELTEEFFQPRGRQGLVFSRDERAVRRRGGRCLDRQHREDKGAV